MGKFIDITGERYGRLIVSERSISKNKNITFWVCKCDCGNVIIASKPNLTTGHTRSCGCIALEIIKKNTNRLKHGESRTRLYFIWQSMKQRCLDEKAKEYINYGKRGIRICDEWLNYENFSNWAKLNGYKNNLTIDRINVNGNYEPLNCKWSTAKEQNRNKRNNVIIEYFGIKKCVSEWSEILGIPKTTILNRLKRYSDPRIILNKNKLKLGIETLTPDEIAEMNARWNI